MNSDFDLIIEPGKGLRQYWQDLWRYRELFYFMAWRDILVRYKQTVIGVAWSVLRPLATMLVLTVVFGRIAKMPSEGVPYPIMANEETIADDQLSRAKRAEESGAAIVVRETLSEDCFFQEINNSVSKIFENADLYSKQAISMAPLNGAKLLIA
jgi:hypothetical protein